LHDNILGSTLRPPSLLYDFITTSPAGFIGHYAGSSRRGAAGFGSSKKWPHLA
jgi:hypothetical protein